MGRFFFGAWAEGRWRLRQLPEADTSTDARALPNAFVPSRPISDRAFVPSWPIRSSSPSWLLGRRSSLDTGRHLQHDEVIVDRLRQYLGDRAFLVVDHRADRDDVGDAAALDAIDDRRVVAVAAAGEDDDVAVGMGLEPGRGGVGHRLVPDDLHGVDAIGRGHLGGGVALELLGRDRLFQELLHGVRKQVVIGDRIEYPKVVKILQENKIESQAAPAAGGSKQQDTELIIFGERSDKIMYHLANCCKPIPGDDVFGFITTGKGLAIHRTNCPNAPKLLANYGHRIVKTKWAKNKEISFLTGVKIIGMDDVGVVSKITSLISAELKINIAALTIEAAEGLFEGNIKVYVHDKEELDELVNRLKDLDGIESVERYDTEDLPGTSVAK